MMKAFYVPSAPLFVRKLNLGIEICITLALGTNSEMLNTSEHFYDLRDNWCISHQILFAIQAHLGASNVVIK